MRSAGRTITSSGSARASRSTSPRSTPRRIAKGTCCANLLRQMRHTAIAASAQGPIYLGYRLGHIQGDDRVFRALVYNKAAMVLHMLRRLVGDDAFFRGSPRASTRPWKFKKAGTDDFRRAMEQSERPRSGAVLRDLDLRRVDPAPEVQLPGLGRRCDRPFRAARRTGDVPITVTVTYASGAHRGHRHRPVGAGTPSGSCR